MRLSPFVLSQKLPLSCASETCSVEFLPVVKPLTYERTNTCVKVHMVAVNSFDVGKTFANQSYLTQDYLSSTKTFDSLQTQ